MKTVLHLISLLFSPRRSFSYRALEAQLQSALTERDAFRDKWEEAMRYIAYESGKPRFNEATGAEQQSSEFQEPPRPNLSEIQSEYEQEKNRRFLAWQEEQKRVGTANDLTN